MIKNIDFAQIYIILPSSKLIQECSMALYSRSIYLSIKAVSRGSGIAIFAPCRIARTAAAGTFPLPDESLYTSATRNSRTEIQLKRQLNTTVNTNLIFKHNMHLL